MTPEEQAQKRAILIARRAARSLFAKRGNNTEVHLNENDLAAHIAATLILAAEDSDRTERELRESLAALSDWRATVTAALRRPGGSHYEDVPEHIRELVAEVESLRTRVALLDRPNRIDGADELHPEQDPILDPRD